MTTCHPQDLRIHFPVHTAINKVDFFVSLKSRVFLWMACLIKSFIQISMVYILQVNLFRPRRRCTQENTARICRSRVWYMSPVQAVRTIDVPHWIFLFHWMFHYNKYHCFHVLIEKWFTSNFSFFNDFFLIFRKISPFQSLFSIEYTIVTHIVHNSLFPKYIIHYGEHFLHFCGLICHHLQHLIKSNVRFKTLSTSILGFYKLMRTKLP